MHLNGLALLCSRSQRGAVHTWMRILELGQPGNRRGNQDVQHYHHAAK
jgi:glutamate/tyrosine decarboxylase-like PLP-dependent enzyme